MQTSVERYIRRIDDKLAKIEKLLSNQQVKKELEFLSHEQVATVLGISRQSLAKIREEGSLNAHKVRGKYKYSRADLDIYLEIAKEK
jgi:excisionase family DNA binding protein